MNQSAVASAIGDMIGNAVADSLNTGSTTFFRMESYRSEQEFALKVGLSGRYLGWKARTQVSNSTHGQQSMVSVQFLQRMYEVVVAPPSTPGGWFTSDFTQAKLQQQINLNRIGPDNLPVYVSKVVYGRMMMFTLKANASESELKGIVQLSYNALGNGAAASLTAKQKNILSEAEITIFSLGGADSATAAMIRSGDWRSYFTVSAPLSTAKPLAYTFTNLADNHDASVTETTNYTRRTCQALSNVPGQLRFLAGQNIAAPVPSPYEVKLADVNGDGRSDLIWNYRSPSTNQVAVSLASAGGVFGAPDVYTSTQPAPGEGWGNLHPQRGRRDRRRPRRPDLELSEQRGEQGLCGRVAVRRRLRLRRAGQRGRRLERLQAVRPGRHGRRRRRRPGLERARQHQRRLPRALQQGRHLRPARALLPAAGRVDTVSPVLRGSEPGWPDGPDLEQRPHQQHQPHLYRDHPAERRRVDLGAAKDHSTVCCWDSYRAVVGDFNGDQVTDIYWELPGSGGGAYIHRFQGNGSGGWNQLGVLNPGHAVDNFAPMTADLNGDGRQDMIWSQAHRRLCLCPRGHLRCQRGGPHLPVGQVVPAAASFNGGQVFIGRVDADGRDDLVWVIPEATTQVFVGLAQP